jgi:hypothetical protein
MSKGEFDTRIPALLVGKATPVRRHLRSVLRRVFKEGSWSSVTPALDYIDIDEAPGWIQIHGPMNLLQGDNVVVWLTMEEVWNVGSTGPDSGYRDLKRILLEGLDHFWFALCLHSGSVFLPFSEERESDRPWVAREALPKMLRWWSVFCSLESRYSMGLPEPAYWPEWGALVVAFCRDLGVDDQELALLQSIDAISAGARIRQLVEAAEND